MATRRNRPHLEIGKATAGAAGAWRAHWIALIVLAILFVALPSLSYCALNFAYVGGALSRFGAGKSMYAVGSPYSFFRFLSFLIAIVFGPAASIGAARITLSGSGDARRTFADAWSAIRSTWLKAIAIDLVLMAPRIFLFVAMPSDNLAERWVRALSGELVGILTAALVGPMGAVFAIENPSALGAVSRAASLLTGQRLRYGLLIVTEVVAATAVGTVWRLVYLASGLQNYGVYEAVVSICERMIFLFWSAAFASAYSQLVAIHETGRPAKVAAVFD